MLITIRNIAIRILNPQKITITGAEVEFNPSEEVMNLIPSEQVDVKYSEMLLWALGRPIQAIKVYRERTGTSLKESKDKLEEWAKHNVAYFRSTDSTYISLTEGRTELLRKLIVAAKLPRNTHLVDTDNLTGHWYAVPAEDFERLRDAVNLAERSLPNAEQN